MAVPARDFRTLRGEARFEQEIKKSRFIGIASPITSEDDARSMLDKIRSETPDATHHCWAYIVGNPEASSRIRASDDGEPSGTAGRPILAVLRHKSIGDAALVVVRYFGGTKLGSGGLTRAYASTAAETLERATLETHVPETLALIRADFPDEAIVRRLVEESGVDLLGTEYGDRVELTIRVATNALDDVRAALRERTSARAQLVAL